jgi:5-formyltetrahydrofolate cyclo-ligase
MAGDLADRKQQLRRALAARRRKLTVEASARAAGAAFALLGEEHAFRAARRVGLYAGLPDELPTQPLFEALVEQGRVCLLPRAQADRRLEFAHCARWEDLRPGRYGVLEPPDGAPRLDPAQGDVVLVPGVAFDREGHRLGRGKGYYDRTFPIAAEAPPLLIGLAYDFQVIDAVPHDANDRRVDAFVTETAVHWRPGAER